MRASRGLTTLLIMASLGSVLPSHFHVASGTICQKPCATRIELPYPVGVDVRPSFGVWRRSFWQSCETCSKFNDNLAHGLAAGQAGIGPSNLIEPKPLVIDNRSDVTGINHISQS